MLRVLQLVSAHPDSWPEERLEWVDSLISRVSALLPGTRSPGQAHFLAATALCTLGRLGFGVEHTARCEHLFNIALDAGYEVRQFGGVRRLMEASMQVSADASREELAHSIFCTWRHCCKAYGEDAVWSHEEFTRLYQVLGGRNVYDFR